MDFVDSVAENSSPRLPFPWRARSQGAGDGVGFSAVSADADADADAVKQQASAAVGSRGRAAGMSRCGLRLATNRGVELMDRLLEQARQWLTSQGVDPDA
ncbi:hypothetical protein [uncultured Microbacterium sp.]|uniref:hypothetical protein n=1 Tax=uncultured Microbacterium sp. TaxID=191216 RepID=UPI0025D5042E|nr:hypothetical protein [uncultured Microbacterium sp.]